MREELKIIPTVTTTGGKGFGQKIRKEKEKFASYDIRNFVSNEKYLPRVGAFADSITRGDGQKVGRSISLDQIVLVRPQIIGRQIDR
jgi:hypothetical protein